MVRYTVHTTHAIPYYIITYNITVVTRKDEVAVTINDTSPALA